VQVDTVSDLDPRQISQTGRREFRNVLKAHNLELAALGCPLRRGLDVPEGQEERIDMLRLALTLSFDLGPRIVVVEVGRVPEKEDDPRFVLMSEALLTLGQHGDRVGAVLALETGLEDGATLRKFLDRFDTGSLRVNLDPANLMMHNFNLYEAAKVLGDKVVHTHAKDAREAGASQQAQEVPLGHGDIDWLAYLGVLEEIDYHGYLTIEREGGNDRVGDVAGGVKFLRRLVG
ncbi:MAG TPA: sugar phosphate isomerase/epimerase family protein, partial [Gemmataceae bacterium]|nr:sugar phosphate isomerase/epimerase family protein [Gemmataceae bacterium]